MDNLPTDVFSMCEGIHCTKKSKSLIRKEAIFFKGPEEQK
jgi:hypothetical protein